MKKTQNAGVTGKAVFVGLMLACASGCGSKDSGVPESPEPVVEELTLPSLPSPNGYQMLVQAGENTRALPSPVESMSRGALEAYLGSHDEVLEILASALEQSSRVVLDGEVEFTDAHVQGQEALRKLANLCLAQAALAEGKVQMQMAMEAYFKLLRIGIEVGRGGLESDLRMGLDFEEKAVARLAGLVRRLPKEAVSSGLETLNAIQEIRPALQSLREWSALLEKTIHAPLLAGLDSSQREQRNARFEAVVDDSMQQLKKLRVLSIKWAARVYEFEHGVLPDGLDKLVPELLPDVPTDPSNGQPFTVAVLKESR